MYLIKQSLSNARTGSCTHSVSVNFTVKITIKSVILFTFFFFLLSQNSNKTMNIIYVFITVKR